MDKNDCIVQQGVGVALNISQTGILIETSNSLFSKYVTLMLADLKNHTIKISGEVAYCKKIKSEKYRVGLNLKGTHAQNIHFVQGLIRAYHHKKYEYQYRSASKRKTAIM